MLSQVIFKTWPYILHVKFNNGAYFVVMQVGIIYNTLKPIQYHRRAKISQNDLFCKLLWLMLLCSWTYATQFVWSIMVTPHGTHNHCDLQLQTNHRLQLYQQMQQSELADFDKTAQKKTIHEILLNRCLSTYNPPPSSFTVIIHQQSKYCTERACM